MRQEDQEALVATLQSVLPFPTREKQLKYSAVLRAAAAAGTATLAVSKLFVVMMSL